MLTVLLANQVQQEIEWAFKLTEQDLEIVGNVVSDNVRRRAGDIERRRGLLARTFDGASGLFSTTTVSGVSSFVHPSLC